MKSKKVTTKKKTGGDSTSVAGKPLPLVGLKKKTDYSTSYNKKGVIHNEKAPDFPYGQAFKSPSAAKVAAASKAAKLASAQGPVKKSTGKK